MSDEIKLRGELVNILGQSKTISKIGIQGYLDEAEILITPQELVEQLIEQGYEVLQHADNKKIAIILPPQPAEECTCKTPEDFCPIHRPFLPHPKSQYCECKEPKPIYNYYHVRICMNDGCKKPILPLPPKPEQDKPENISIDILADAYEGGNLISPFRLGKQEIQALGIYEEKGIKFWVIKKNDRKKPKQEIKEIIIPIRLEHPCNFLEYAVKEIIDKVNDLIRDHKLLWQVVNEMRKEK